MVLDKKKSRIKVFNLDGVLGLVSTGVEKRRDVFE